MSARISTRLGLVQALLAVTLVLTFVAVDPGAPPAAADPLFKAPFRCGEQWTASTYSGHGQAVDFNRYPTDAGEPVLASAPGTATTGFSSVAGNYVKVNHGGGWSTFYGHLATFSVASGATVGAGSQLGTVGMTGSATGPHIHYEQRLNDTGQPARFDGNTFPIGTAYTSSDPKVTSTNCGSSALYDITGDGRDDLMWHEQALNAQLTTFVSSGSAMGIVRGPSGIGKPDFACVADVNGDRRADVIWYEAWLKVGSNPPGTITVFTSNGNGSSFSAAQRMFGIGAPSWAGCGDVTGDGKADIVWHEAGLNYTISTFVSTGSGFVITRGPAAISVPDFACVADVSGDGRADIVWYESWMKVGTNPAGTVSAFVSGGNGASFSLQRWMYGIGRPTWAGCGDVTGDGKADLMWHEAGLNSTLSTFVSNGSGMGIVRGPSGIGVPRTAAVADVTGDRRADVVWYEDWLKVGTNAPGTVSVFVSNGSGSTFSLQRWMYGIGSPSWSGPGDVGYGRGDGVLRGVGAPALTDATFGSGSATVGWSAATTAGSPVDGYQAAIRIKSGTSWGAWSYVAVAASTRSHTWTGLPLSASVELMVRARNWAGYGPWSIVATRTSAQTVAAPAPSFADGCGTAQDQVAIPAATGIEYLVNGVPKTADVHSASGTVSVTARAKAGFALSGETTWSRTFSAKACVAVMATPPLNTPTAVAGTVRVTWSASGAPSAGPLTYDVQRRLVTVGSAGSRVYSSWSTVRAATTTVSATLSASPGSVQQYRVRVRDRLGNLSAWSAVAATTIVLNEGSRSLIYRGSWSTARATGYYLGTTKASARRGASVSTTGWTSRISVVGTKSPRGGRFAVVVDGVRRATVDTYATSVVNRRTLVSIPVPYGRHAVRIVNLGTPGRQTIRLDGIGLGR
jgi:hypothetical protein